MGIFSCAKCGCFTLGLNCEACSRLSFNALSVRSPKNMWKTHSLMLPPPRKDSSISVANGKLWFDFPPEEMTAAEARQVISDILQGLHALEARP